jgi:sulfate/thiosulfate-binding protein
MKFLNIKPILISFALITVLSASSKEITLLNVSYDPTQELYEEINPAFIKFWQQKTGDKIVVRQSHGGSGKQARSVIDGLPADVVTLALGYDVDALQEKGKLIPKNWQKRLPNNSAPYTSTIVFLVRKGNPKGIKDWDDLAKPGVSVVTPNPKTSGGARWNYLAGWAWGLKKFANDETKVRDFIGKLYKNVPALDTGARGSTVTFVQRGVGDVLVAWENEALLTLKESPDKFEMITPSLSILAEPTVSVVDRVVDRKGTRQVAQAYLEFLYSPEGQEIAARNFYRPRLPELAEKYSNVFKRLDLITIDEVFGGWQKAQKTHFSEGGEFDKLFHP